MESIEKRRIARAYLERLDIFELEEKALTDRINLFKKKMGPAGYPKSSAIEGGIGGGRMTTMKEFTHFTNLCGELDDLRARTVEAELDIIQKIYNIAIGQYRSLLLEKYLNKKTVYELSEMYRKFGLDGCSIESVKRLNRQALEMFFDANPEIAKIAVAPI